MAGSLTEVILLHGSLNVIATVLVYLSAIYYCPSTVDAVLMKVPEGLKCWPYDPTATRTCFHSELLDMWIVPYVICLIPVAFIDCCTKRLNTNHRWWKIGSSPVFYLYMSYCIQQTVQENTHTVGTIHVTPETISNRFEHKLPPFSKLILYALVVLATFVVLVAMHMALVLYEEWQWGRMGHSPYPAVTRHLIVIGPYAYMRNPLITCLFLRELLLHVVIGRHINVLIYLLLALGVFTAWLKYFEEPELEQRFGQQYKAYCDHIPRWIPRLRPYSESVYDLENAQE